MIQTENFEQVSVNSAAELRQWLEQHHTQKESVWLVTWKKSVAATYVSVDEVLDELLCFGWIDGIRRKLDDTRTMQLISPRKAEHWAQTYKDRAERLIREGRMAEPGLRAIEASKNSGLWDFMSDVDQLIIPPDLQAGLDAQPGASAFFHAINDSSKRFVLRWLKLAKTPKTRAARVAELARLSARGEKLKGS